MNLCNSYVELSVLLTASEDIEADGTLTLCQIYIDFTPEKQWHYQSWVHVAGKMDYLTVLSRIASTERRDD